MQKDSRSSRSSDLHGKGGMWQPVHADECEEQLFELLAGITGRDVLPDSVFHRKENLMFVGCVMFEQYFYLQ